MTISGFAIEQQPATYAAVIARKANRSELSDLFGQCFGQVFGTLAQKGIAPASAPIVRYLNMEEPLEFEAGVMVASAFAGDGDVVGREFPAAEVAVATYAGPYDGITAAHMEMQDWIRSQGRTVQGTSVEEYITDPGENPDPATWLTKITYPLAQQ